MDDKTFRFEDDDLSDDLPAPGFYPSVVVGARFRRSERGNDTIQVVYGLDGAPPGHDRVAEYFLIRGGSPRGRALSRQRLVGLYRACGLEPKGGEAIDPADLFGLPLEVRVEHETWQGRLRLRVADHRPLRGAADTSAEPVPF